MGYNPFTHAPGGVPNEAAYRLANAHLPQPQAYLPPVPSRALDPDAAEEHDRRTKARYAREQRQKADEKGKAARLAQEIADLEQRLPRSIENPAGPTPNGWVAAGVALWGSNSLRTLVSMDGDVRPANDVVRGAPTTAILASGQMHTVLMNLDNRKIWLTAHVGGTYP